jgi:hypothetical protein
MTYLLILSAILLLLGLTAVLMIFFKKVNRRFESFEQRLNNLSTIGTCFPDFIEKGEGITRHISGELQNRQDALTNLIVKAEETFQKLGALENKIQDHKLDKETIDKILILFNHGFSSQEIAPKLNIAVGEIELVIKLKQYLNSPLKEKL